MTTEGSSEKWPAYDNVGELLTELDLTDSDMTLAAEIVNDHVRAWHLAQVRAAQERSQRELAAAMGVSQPRVSALERGDLESVTLATLRAYVRALGGTLDINATFGNNQYRLV